MAISDEQLAACKTLCEFESLPEKLKKIIIELPLEAVTYDNPINGESVRRQKKCCQIRAGFGSTSSGVARNMCLSGLLNYTKYPIPEVREASKEAIRTITRNMTLEECEEFKSFLQSDGKDEFTGAPRLQKYR